jgi:hypothetical protein
MCEILVEIYTRIGSYLGPSMSASSTTSLSATGLFPQPPMVARGAGSGALGLSPTLIDTVYKVDARLKVCAVKPFRTLDVRAPAQGPVAPSKVAAKLTTPFLRAHPDRN